MKNKEKRHVQDLKNVLNSLGLRVSGKKNELEERIQEQKYF